MKDKFIESFREALEIEGHPVNMSDAFRDYDEWNSLGQLSLIAMLDEEFEVTIEDGIFKDLVTVNDLYNEVLKWVSEKN